MSSIAVRGGETSLQTVIRQLSPQFEPIARIEEEVHFTPKRLFLVNDQSQGALEYVDRLKD